MQLSILFPFLKWVACGTRSIVLTSKITARWKERRKGFLPCSSQPLSWLSSLFCSRICAAKPHRGWVYQQGLPDHCHGMHGYLLSPCTKFSSGESPALFWSATTTCHGRKDPFYMSFTVKNLYHSVTISSFSRTTTLEIEQDNFSEQKIKLFSSGMPKTVAIASDETQNSLLQNMNSCPSHAASLF